MNNDILFISVKTLATHSEINENIDANILTPTIKEAQEIELRPILGLNLYNKLKDLIETNTVTDHYKTLLDIYIRPVLIQAVLTDLPFKLNFRFTNTGVTTRTSEHATAPDYKSLQIISDNYKSKKVFYAGELTRFLISNALHFPEYCSESNLADAPKKETFTCGLYLG